MIQKEPKRAQKIPKYSEGFQKIPIPEDSLLFLANALRKANGSRKLP